MWYVNLIIEKINLKTLIFSQFSKMYQQKIFINRKRMYKA
jgi:hypothetical protein